MLAKIVQISNNFSVASQIDRGDFPLIAAAGFRTIINNRPKTEDGQPVTTDEAMELAHREGVVYWHLPLTTATLTPADVVAFSALVDSLDGPVLAHCRSGTRCYLVWAAGQVAKGAAPDTLISQAADRGFDISTLARLPWLDQLRP